MVVGCLVGGRIRECGHIRQRVARDSRAGEMARGTASAGAGETDASGQVLAVAWSTSRGK